MPRLDRRSPSGRIWFAQGLRGIAVLLVLLEHFLLTFWINNQGAAATAFVKPLDGDVWDQPWTDFFITLVQNHFVIGMVAVALFFLISGLVIPISLERYPIGRFMVARFFRVWPVWIGSLAVIAITFGLYGAFHGTPYPYDLSTWLWNLTLFQDLNGTIAINPVVWTLVVEIKFYVLCGLLAWRFGLTRPAVLLAPLGVIAAATWAMKGGLAGALVAHEGLYKVVSALLFSGKFVAFMFIGVCFYNLFRGAWSPWRSLWVSSACGALFVASILGGFEPGYWKKEILLTYAIGLGIFWLAYAARERVPYSRTVDFFANISYPLYALHYLVGTTILTLIYPTHEIPVLNTLEMIAIITLLAWLMHKYLENPANQFGKWVRLDRATLRRVLRRPGSRPAPARRPRPALEQGPGEAQAVASESAAGTTAYSAGPTG